MDGVVQGLGRLVFAVGVGIALWFVFFFPTVPEPPNAYAAFCTVENITASAEFDDERGMPLEERRLDFVLHVHRGRPGTWDEAKATWASGTAPVKGCETLDACLKQSRLPLVSETFRCRVGGSPARVFLLAETPPLTTRTMGMLALICTVTCLPCCLLGGLWQVLSAAFGWKAPPLFVCEAPGPHKEV